MYIKHNTNQQLRYREPDTQIGKRKFTDAANAVECPQVRFIRIDGSLFFGATSHIRETLAAQDQVSPQQKHIAVIAHGINFNDLAGAHYLAEEAEKRRAAGGGLYFIRVKDTLQEQLAETGALKIIGGNNLYDSKTEAIKAIYQRLDREVCRTCPARIFRECAAVPVAEATAPSAATGR
jgi:SulP family sulfate permease